MQLKSDGTVEIIFEEALSLVVTMYREDSGKYQVQTSSLSSFFCSFVGRKKLVTL
jgi:deoxycytidine triphosphate deaminase